MKMKDEKRRGIEKQHGKYNSVWLERNSVHGYHYCTGKYYDEQIRTYEWW